MTIRRTRVDTQTQRELLSPERQSVAAGALVGGKFVGQRVLKMY